MLRLDNLNIDYMQWWIALSKNQDFPGRSSFEIYDEVPTSAPSYNTIAKFKVLYL